MLCKKKPSQFELDFRSVLATGRPEVSDEPAPERPAALALRRHPCLPGACGGGPTMSRAYRGVGPKSKRAAKIAWIILAILHRRALGRKA